MYARHVSCQLKQITRDELTQMFDGEILPLLQKQSGFNDEITFVDPDGRQVLAISLWDSKASAESLQPRGLSPGAQDAWASD